MHLIGNPDITRSLCNASFLLHNFSPDFYGGFNELPDESLVLASPNCSKTRDKSLAD